MQNSMILRTIILQFFFLVQVIPVLSQSHDKEESGWEQFTSSLDMPINGRFDYRNIQFGNDIDGYVDDSRFRMSSLLFMLNGKINENFTFNYRQAFNQTGVDDSNLSNNIQVATINYTTDNKKWLFKAGKFFYGYGTMEQQYWPYDVYRYSYVNNNVRLWKTGVHAEHITASGQHIAFQVANGVNEIDSLGKQIQATQFNVYWWGHIVKDFIKVYSNVTTLSNYNLYDGMPFAFSLGLQWNFDTFWIDTDFITARNMPNFNKNGTYYSTPIKFKYNGKHFRPFIKLIFDQVMFDSENDAVIVTNPVTEKPELVKNSLMITYEVALEFYPWEDKDFNLHIVGTYADANNHYFQQENTDPSSRNEYNTQFQLLAGISFNFDAFHLK
ncbi:porin [Flammeovirga sp. SubArs3]|uniref:porin n=1 Tax=Flammeovirga sp. SubArs3 TaxID=2995316 RepID=UPI00248A96CA|nr:porin [Flammeovirga sp. SubArs3]